jgi:hypothetical protein
MGKGGGGAPTQTTSTNYQTNIPEYARPYVETMLGATQQQLFQGTPTGDGGFNITGFQPYKAYGGTYDAQGNQTSYDPSKAVAGFSPLQQQAQQGIANLQVPGQYNQAMQGTANAGMGGFGVANQATTGGFQNEVGGYMNPYLNMALQPALQEAQRQYGITGAQQQSAATQAGAFGGSREAIMAAENERNKNTAMNNIIGQGYNQAFQGAQQQYNQNLQNQLAGYGLAGQQAGQLAGIAGQQLGAEQGIYGAQNTMGAQQQAQQQQIINQSMQDYANAQQYPLMQLGTMSNMIRGLPMQAQTTQQYAAAPNQLTQGIGAAGAAASLYNATKAEGGVIKSMASGGIASIPSYNVGGRIRAQLENMSPQDLQQIAENSESEEMQKMAKEILQQSQPVQRAASGGILQYKEPSKDNNEGVTTDMTARGEGSMMDRIEAAGAGTPREVATQAAAPKTAAPDYTVGNPAGGILGNRTAGMYPQAPAAAPTAPITNGIKGPITSAALARDPSLFGLTPDMLRKQEALDKEAGRSQESYKAEIQAATGPNVGREEYRKNAMAEKANLADEAYRQKQMRLAEFFATWGSTPGPTLVAGMSALKAKIPDMINDEKEAKKLRREADKIIYDLDEATRLENKGDDKEAYARKMDTVKRAEELQKQIAGIREKQMSTVGTLAANENTAAASRYHADKQAEANKIAAAQRGDMKLLGLYEQAKDRIADAIKEKEKAENTEQFREWQKTITRATRTAKDANGDFDPSKIPAMYKKPYEDATAAIKAHNEAWNKREEQLIKNKDDLRERFRSGAGEEAPTKIDKSKTQAYKNKERPWRSTLKKQKLLVIQTLNLLTFLLKILRWM